MVSLASRARHRCTRRPVWRSSSSFPSKPRPARPARSRRPWPRSLRDRWPSRSGADLRRGWDPGQGCAAWSAGTCPSTRPAPIRCVRPPRRASAGHRWCLAPSSGAPPRRRPRGRCGSSRRRWRRAPSRPTTAPGTSRAVRLRTADRARREQVTGAQRGAVDGHVGEHLGGDQYIVRYGGRLITSPFSSTSTSMSSRGSRPGRGRGAARMLLGQVDPGGVERGQRGDPRRDRGRERLAQERSERDVLRRLHVPGRRVVEARDAEDVVGKAAERTAATRSDGAPTTKPSSASMSSRRDGPYVGALSSGALRCPDAGRPACRTRRRCRPARGSRSAGAASSGSAARSRAGTSCRRCRVVERGVEVDVVGDLERQVQGHLLEGQRLQPPSMSVRTSSRVCARPPVRVP